MRLLLIAVMVLCGAAMAMADEYKIADMNGTILRTKAGGDESVGQYAFGSAGGDSDFTSYIPKDAEVTKESDFNFDDSSKFSRAYTVESKKDALRIKIYFHKIGEVTFLPWWASEILGAIGYSIGPPTKFEHGIKPDAGEFFINCGTAGEAGSPARLAGAQEAVAIAVRNGNAIIVALIEYGGANLERNRDLASRFYSNVVFAHESDKSFAIDKTLTFTPTGTKIAVRTSKDWQHGTAEDKTDTSVLTSIRSTNGETNAIVETRIIAQDSERQDYEENAKQYFAGFVHHLGAFDEDKGYKFGPNPISESMKTKHRMFSYLFQIMAKNGVPHMIRISYLKGTKEDVAVLSLVPERVTLGALFLAFKARASAEKLAIDAIDLADETMN